MSFSTVESRTPLAIAVQVSEDTVSVELADSVNGLRQTGSRQRCLFALYDDIESASRQSMDAISHPDERCRQGLSGDTQAPQRTARRLRYPPQFDAF